MRCAYVIAGGMTFFGFATAIRLDFGTWEFRLAYRLSAAGRRTARLMPNECPNPRAGLSMRQSRQLLTAPGTVKKLKCFLE